MAIHGVTPIESFGEVTKIRECGRRALTIPWHVHMVSTKKRLAAENAHDPS